MKKHIKVIAVILLLATLSLFLFACGGQNDTEGNATIVVLDGDNTKVYSVDLAKLPSGDSQTGLMAVLDYLKENNGLTYTSQDSAYGPYLTQVNGIEESYGTEVGSSVFVALYTDVESDIDVSVEPTKITYDGKEYVSSGKGASSMSVKAGCTIIIAKGTY
ncbi:MAG: hypothetical protein K2G37_04770 [Clostridia bacterium]|nr:hypothetical protein [Clostridia bacterium]MDE7328267.1 hypothetical protein [Clostridia bacterium]